MPGAGLSISNGRNPGALAQQPRISLRHSAQTPTYARTTRTPPELGILLVHQALACFLFRPRHTWEGSTRHQLTMQMKAVQGVRSVQARSRASACILSTRMQVTGPRTVRMAAGAPWAGGHVTSSPTKPPCSTGPQCGHACASYTDSLALPRSCIRELHPFNSAASLLAHCPSPNRARRRRRGDGPPHDRPRVPELSGHEGTGPVQGEGGA